MASVNSARLWLIPTHVTYISNGYNKFLDKDGYRAIQPPWRTLTAIDLNSGKTVWKIPLGELAAASYDKVFRALDKATG